MNTETVNPNLQYDSNDALIISDILSGDSDSFELLVRKYNSSLYRLARSFKLNHADSQDILQETYLAAFKSLKSFGHKSSFKTWISKILVNKCLYKFNTSDFKCKSDVQIEHLTPSMTIFPTEYARKEFSNALESMLESMPLHYRTVFIFREIEGLNVTQTAEVLSITDANVKVRLNRAKKLLQKKFAHYFYSDVYGSDQN